MNDLNNEILEENANNTSEDKPKRKNVFQNKNFTLVFLGALVSNIASLFYFAAFYCYFVVRKTFKKIPFKSCGGKYGLNTLYGGDKFLLSFSVEFGQNVVEYKYGVFARTRFK